MTPIHPRRRSPTRLHEMLLAGLDEPLTQLVDTLTDAMHWCDVHGEDFHAAYHLARAQYLAESHLMIQRERNRHDAYP